MTAMAITLCVVCQAFLITGQLLLKHAMRATVGPGARWSRGMGRLAVGIGCMTVWFFLWLGLLQRWDLSHLFPFEGLNPALVAMAAWIFLRERMAITSWLGIVMISFGLALVAGS
jgi:undecaprenyl phosphate-alpha-L-ara4N flippase subunit ArnE